MNSALRPVGNAAQLPPLARGRSAISGGELAIAVHYEPSGLDPQLDAAELALQMTAAVFDPLINKTVDGDYLPGLAEGFDISADACVYTLRLRDDVFFHDGEPLTAAAVKFSLDRARDPAKPSRLAGPLLGSYRETRVLDELTVEIHLTRPYALLLDALSQGWLAPVSPAAVRRLGAGFKRRPVGTGPFVFQEWVAGEHIVLRRNPHYAWAPPLVDNRGPAHLDAIRFVFIADAAARTAALESGAVDAVFNLPPADIARLRGTRGLQVEVRPVGGIPVCMMMNTARLGTCELAVRRAINYAIDQDALARTLFHGEIPRAFGPVSQFTPGYEPAVEDFYAYAPATARHLLEEAGWSDRDGDGVREKNGERLILDFAALPVNHQQELGAIVAQQLREVGIQVEITLADPLPWLRAGMRGDHHLVPLGHYASSAQPLGLVYHSRHSGADGYGWSKRSARHRPGFDALLERAESSRRGDDATPLLQQAQRLVMEEALAVPLHCHTLAVGRRAGVRGLRFDAIGAYPLFHDTQL